MVEVQSYLFTIALPVMQWQQKTARDVCDFVLYPEVRFYMSEAFYIMHNLRTHNQEEHIHRMTIGITLLNFILTPYRQWYY